MERNKVCSVLRKMKQTDKARAFDLIVDNFSKNEQSFGHDAEKILSWCATWFANEE